MESIQTDKTYGNILNNFPSDHFWANVARLCFGLNMLTTTPLEAFVCRETIENFLFPGEMFEYKRHFIITTALVVTSMSSESVILGCEGRNVPIVSVAVSLLTCDLGLVLELTGGFGATCLAFIFRKSYQTTSIRLLLYLYGLTGSCGMLDKNLAQALRPE